MRKLRSYIWPAYERLRKFWYIWTILGAWLFFLAVALLPAGYSLLFIFVIGAYIGLFLFLRSEHEKGIEQLVGSTKRSGTAPGHTAKKAKSGI